MANRGIEDFDHIFYDGQYPTPPSNRQHEGQPAQMVPYTSASMSVGNYTYPPHSSMLAYDPAADPSLSMGLDPGSAFPYDLSTYPSSAAAVGHGLNQFAPLQPQDPSSETGSVYSTAQSQDPGAAVFWNQPQPGGSGPSFQGSLSHQALPSRLAPSADSTLQRGQPQASTSGPVHRYIQPKKSIAGKDTGSTGIGSGETTPYSNIYSSSGLDVVGMLSQVVSRPNPKINIGPVDLSCAFVLCDIEKEDHPIIYVSHAFERLTGYQERDIIGHNCRFLQSPDGVVEPGAPRKFVDSYTAFRLKTTIEQQSETQVSIINYRKGGQPFMNLVTMIPVRWESKDFRYFVGFQVDLVERPEAVRRLNPDGSFMIDYHRNQLPSYLVPPSDMWQDEPGPAMQFSPSQVSMILDNLQRGQPVARSHLQHVLVENADDVIFVLSYEGEFLYLSPSCRAVLEYNPGDLVGKTLSTICHPSDIGPVTRDLRACTSTEPISVIYRIRRKHSGFAWFENHGGWHISERGRQFMVLVGRIIPVYALSHLTKMKPDASAENDLWAKLSISGLILFMSSKSRAVLGRAPDDLVGKGIQDIIVGDSSQQDPGLQQALETCRAGKQATFTHKIRHRKGHIFPAQTTLYPGDLNDDTPAPTTPSFLVAQLCFPRVPTDDALKNQSSDANNVLGIPQQQQEPNQSPATTSASASALHPKPHPNYPEPFISSTSAAITTSSSPEKPNTTTTDPPPTFFEELNPTRGSNWSFELRELEKQNRVLAEEVQRLLAKRKKRKRRQNAVAVEKTCAVCSTRSTPEWRRGPSGNRDLCNSCGLRWAKQMKSAMQEQAEKSGNGAGVGMGA
ncbi:PAS domain-containing protein [Aspergillus pseudodeflectus]|uniref:PAS domain-containing protein n=1 Tax=Aspergillus pseudodeflectus TaxID=176178 RepID=A0ABR4JVD0_9EURO